MANSKINLKKEQGAETRRKIHESARLLFSKNEFDDVSVDSIVENAGVSKGTFYIHFESKNALIASFISEYSIGLDWEYKTFLNALPSDLSSSDVLLALVEKIVDIMVEKTGYEAICKVYQIQLSKAIGTEALTGYGRELYQLICDILRKGISNGEFETAVPLNTLSRHYVMAMRGLCYEWCIRYPDFDLKAEALAHFKLLLAAITVRSTATM